MWVVDWKKLQMQACRLWSHTVDVTPPQAATKIMAGMAEQQTEWRNRMADGMVEWREWREWRNGGKNGRIAEWQKWLHTYYLRYTHTKDTDDDDDNDDTLIFYSIEYGCSNMNFYFISMDFQTWSVQTRIALLILCSKRHKDKISRCLFIGISKYHANFDKMHA